MSTFLNFVTVVSNWSLHIPHQIYSKVLRDFPHIRILSSERIEIRWNSSLHFVLSQRICYLKNYFSACCQNRQTFWYWDKSKRKSHNGNVRGVNDTHDCCSGCNAYRRGCASGHAFNTGKSCRNYILILWKLNHRYITHIFPNYGRNCDWDDKCWSGKLFSTVLSFYLWIRFFMTRYSTVSPPLSEVTLQWSEREFYPRSHL